MDEELRRLIQAEAEAIAERDMQMLDKGFTHRVTWWNHRTGGDDVQADAYFGADPTTLTNKDGEAWRLWRQILYECSPGNGIIDYKIYKLSELDHR